MMTRTFLGGFLAVVVLALGLRAQQATTPTTLASPGATVLAPGGRVTVDLRTFLGVPGVTGQVVQFDTVRGTFNAELLSNDAPRTVANFLNYVNRGSYTNSFFHRSVRNFVIQGGGFTVAGSTVNAIPADAPVQNEFKNSNLRGTMAMAKTGLGPDTATNQWFVNLSDNSANLNNQNGGFTVFARVLGNGITVADSIAALSIVDASGILNGAFDQLPVLGLPVSPASLVVVRSVRPVPIFPTTNGEAAVVTFSATNQNSIVAAGSVSGSTLTITGGVAGTTTVRARATDSNGSAAEVVFNVTVAASAPVITAQPVNLIAAAGRMMVLNVAASGPGLTYQWKRIPAGPIAGATGPQLIVNPVTASDAGIYYCTVSNSSGEVDSAGAIVAVRANGTNRLSSLSVRANLDATQVLTVGFSTTAAKNLLVRAVGPKLVDFGVPNFNPDPRLEIFDGTQRPTANNDNWAATLGPVFQSYGAFAFDAASRDAALVTRSSGAATAEIKSPGNGIVLVEVYEEVAATPATLNGVSTLHRVGTGGGILIAGFAVSGDVAKTLLIRGVGPKLATFGVGDRLADPKIEVRSVTDVVLAANDDWSASVAAATPGLGFAFDPGSKDAALLVTLPPGAYTAQLSGADGGTGNGLIEIYEVP